MRIGETSPMAPRSILVSGNWVAARTRMSGTFDGEFASGPLGPAQPTGQPVSFAVHKVFRYDDDGRLAEEWALVDNLGLLRQLGIEIPAATSTRPGAMSSGGETRSTARRFGPLAVAAAAIAVQGRVPLAVGWALHVATDRSLGYGLRGADGGQRREPTPGPG